MMHPVRSLVAYISRFMTLFPGDVVATGTPGGVGMGMQPPRFLRPGDLVEWGIEGIGEMRQRIVAGLKSCPGLGAGCRARWIPLAGLCRAS